MKISVVNKNLQVLLSNLTVDIPFLTTCNKILDTIYGNYIYSLLIDETTLVSTTCLEIINLYRNFHCLLLKIFNQEPSNVEIYNLITDYDRDSNNVLKDLVKKISSFYGISQFTVLRRFSLEPSMLIPVQLSPINFKKLFVTYPEKTDAITQELLCKPTVTTSDYPDLQGDVLLLLKYFLAQNKHVNNYPFMRDNCNGSCNICIIEKIIVAKIKVRDYFGVSFLGSFMDIYKLHFTDTLMYSKLFQMSNVLENGYIELYLDFLKCAESTLAKKVFKKTLRKIINNTFFNHFFNNDHLKTKSPLHPVLLNIFDIYLSASRIFKNHSKPCRNITIFMFKVIFRTITMQSIDEHYDNINHILPKLGKLALLSLFSVDQVSYADNYMIIRHTEKDGNCCEGESDQVGYEYGIHSDMTDKNLICVLLSVVTYLETEFIKRNYSSDAMIKDFNDGNMVYFLDVSQNVLFEACFCNEFINVQTNLITNPKLQEIVTKITSITNNKEKVTTMDVVTHYFGLQNAYKMALKFNNLTLIEHLIPVIIPTIDHLKEYLVTSTLDPLIIMNFLNYKLQIDNEIINLYLSKFEGSKRFDSESEISNKHIIEVNDIDEYKRILDKFNLNDTADDIFAYNTCYRVCLNLLIDCMIEPLDNNVIQQNIYKLFKNCLIDHELVKKLNISFDDNTYYICYAVNRLGNYNSYFVGSQYALRNSLMSMKVKAFNTLLEKNPELLIDNYCYEIVALKNKLLFTQFKKLYTPTVMSISYVGKHTKTTLDQIYATAKDIQTQEYMERRCGVK